VGQKCTLVSSSIASDPQGAQRARGSGHGPAPHLVAGRSRLVLFCYCLKETERERTYVATGGIQPREEPYTTALASTETRHLLLTSGDESGRVHGRRYAFANYVLPVVVHLGARNHRRHCAARPSRRENTSDDGASAGVSGERLGLGAWGLPARGQAPELRAEPRAGAKGPGGLAAVHRSRRGHCGPP